MAGLDFRPGSAAVPTSKVEISVSARNLRDRDTFSKSDPMCVLFMKSIGSNNYLEVGRTEMIKDCLNPEFVKKFIVDYFFEESQKLKFELYDVDSPSSKLNAHDFLGRIECTLGEIVGASGGRLNRKLSGLGNNPGTITVRAEELSNCKELVTLNLSGTKLDKKDTFGKSDPFLVISRVNDDDSFTAVHKTEVIKNTLNPTWRPFTLKVGLLCHGDHNRTIKFDCYDWDSDGSHDFIGAFQTTLEDLRQPSKHFELINPKKKAKKKGYKNSGVINVLSCRIEEDHTFLDYVQGGMEINFTVAIDFTASNGDPRTSQSLHYMNTQQPNHYVSALTAVGEIIQDYDTDKMFPALGFGAKLPNGKVSHEFFLNGDATNPYCQGIAGVLAAYQRTLHSVQLWGPTNFSPVINHVAKFAEAYQDGSHYFVLLILTDGVITDMPQTKQAIVRASSLPMSIIIVGVGEAEFDAMEELDADNQRLSAYGRYAERDIVQFVPFREFVGGRYGSNLEMSKAYLAKEVLAEIPDQVTGFMRKKGIKPRPPRTDSAQTQSVGPAFNAQPQSQTGFTNGMPPNQPTQGTTGAQPTAGYGAPPPAGQQGGYGAPPPAGQQGGYGALPPTGQQAGYGAPPPVGQQAGYGAPPPAGPGYGAPPPAGKQAGYGAPPPAGQQAGYGAPPPAGPGYGAPPPAGQQAGYGAPPPAGPGYGAPPPAGQQVGYGTATGGQKGAYGAPAPGHQGAYGAPAPGYQGNYGAPASGQQGAYGAPAPGQQGAYGAPPPGQQGAYGAPAPGQQGAYGAPAPGQQSVYGAPAPGQQSVYGAPAQHQQSSYGTSAPARQSGYGTSAPAHQSGYGAPS